MAHNSIVQNVASIQRMRDSISWRRQYFIWSRRIIRVTIFPRKLCHRDTISEQPNFLRHRIRETGDQFGVALFPCPTGIVTLQSTFSTSHLHFIPLSAVLHLLYQSYISRVLFSLFRFDRRRGLAASRYRYPSWSILTGMPVCEWQSSSGTVLYYPWFWQSRFKVACVHSIWQLLLHCSSELKWTLCSMILLVPDLIHCQYT